MFPGFYWFPARSDGTIGTHSYQVSKILPKCAPFAILDFGGTKRKTVSVWSIIDSEWSGYLDISAFAFCHSCL
jgi:hypothetical protein